jgi:cytoskeletal protein RodZ
MQTIGQILKSERLKKRIPLSLLEKKTKIKKDFLQKIENENWESLPEFPIVSGFVKNIASFLGLSTENINAVLRRDYPPKKLFVNPKPDIESKFMWSPKLTFAVCISVVILLVLGYLGLEYKKFVSPPNLIVNLPKQNQLVNDFFVKVEGKTTTDVSLTVNNQPVILDMEGKFQTEISITKETKSLKFKAVSRSGKITEKEINISVE